MKRFTILLVDDNENNLHVLKLLINSHFDNIDILLAISSYEAINIITNKDIDLIISDVQMPGLSGIELASYVNTVKSIRHIPIILISAMYNSKKMIQQGYEAGIVDYISKPIDDDLLCSKLSVYINIYNERKEHLKEITQLKETTVVNESIPNAEYYLNLLDFDECLIDLSNIEQLKEEFVR